MKAIICGASDVGASIANYLFEDKNQVSIIDLDKARLKKLENQMDVQTICGPASSPEVLERAGAKDADLIIAVTGSDEVNMIVCFEAGRLFNIPTKIARIRSGIYTNRVFDGFWDEMHVDVVISPEAEIAKTILRNLKNAGALEFIELQNKVVFVGAKCQAGATLEKMRIDKIDKSFPEFHICVAGILRDGVNIEITSKTTLQAGDEIYIVTENEYYEQVLEALGHPSKRTQRVVIIGAGRVGLSLARLLEHENMASHLSMIERVSEKAEYAARQLSDTMVIKGDALDETILDEAGVDKADSVISLTAEDEDNILLSLLVKHQNVKRTFALINKTIYNNMLSNLGVDVIVNSNAIATSTILQHIRKGQIRSIYSLKAQIGDLMEFEVLETSKIVGMPLSKLKSKKGMHICAVVRQGQLMELKDTLTIQNADNVVVLGQPAKYKEIEKLFAAGLFFF